MSKKEVRNGWYRIVFERNEERSNTYVIADSEETARSLILPEWQPFIVSITRVSHFYV